MYDTGSTAFMVVCTMLVALMTPGLSFFYGGLSRRKNVVNTMTMVMAVIGVVGVMWVICGWSFAYGGDGSIPFFGGFDQIGCLSATDSLLTTSTNVPEGATYPPIVNIGFQMAFAMISCAIITGAVAGRMKFGAVVLFIAIWVPLVYAPLAHMVWGGEGALISEMIGALDFAGGDVVHISSGVTGLVLCLLLGKRRGFGIMNYRAHNVPFVVLGATLLWFGWFGFNAGSQFAADDVAALALLNTIASSGAGMAAWMLVERIRIGKPTLVGACTGLVTGLVGITPAAGFVEPWAAIIIGLLTAPCCFFAISYAKRKIGYDDALDAFGCHSVGGVVGGLLTGIFCVPELSWTNYGGLLYTGDLTLLGSQLLGILVTLVFVVFGALLIGFFVKAAFGGTLRVSEEDEVLGLDVTNHGESAYPAYLGID